MSKEFSCDFIFGEKIGDIKEMDYRKLPGFIARVKRIFLFGRFSYEEKVYRLIKEGNYSTLIISESYYSVTFWMILFNSYFSKRKVIIWGHGSYGKEHFIVKLLKKIALSLSEYYFLYGHYAKESILKNRIATENKLVVIYNSLDYETQFNLRNKIIKTSTYSNRFKNDFKNLIFIGRLTSIKRLDILLNALSLLLKSGNKMNLIIIGDGEMRSSLEKLVINLEINEFVWFYGPCYNEEPLAELIYNSDLCVSPGNVGLTAIHSMMYGTPVCTHNSYMYQMPEYEAIIDGETGCFFKKDDLLSLTDNILNWINTSPEREIVRRKCYKVVDEKYNPNVQIEIMKRVLN